MPRCCSLFYINGIESSINGIESYIIGIESYINGVESFINGIESYINGVESSINGVESSINGAYTKTINITRVYPQTLMAILKFMITPKLFFSKSQPFAFFKA